MNHKRHASSISGFFSVSHPFFYFGIPDNQQSSTTLHSGSPEPPLWLRHPGSFRSTACSDPLDGQAETLLALSRWKNIQDFSHVDFYQWENHEDCWSNGYLKVPRLESKISHHLEEDNHLPTATFKGNMRYVIVPS